MLVEQSLLSELERSMAHPDRCSDPQNRVARLEDLLSLAVALLADERGISIEQVRERLWRQSPAQSAAPPPPIRLLRREEVESRTGLSTSTLYQRMLVGKFPKPVPLGDKARRWVESEVDDWINALIAARKGRR